MAEKNHWKRLTNPEYLGAYALSPGQDLIATIKKVGLEMVVGADGKKEECTVLRFVEPDIKPMILNVTNAKTIEKLYKTPYIEDWAGLKIQIYVDKVKAFGDVVDALRIRGHKPRETKPAVEIKCSQCESVLTAFGRMNPEQLAKYTQEKYGEILCANCAKTAAETAEVAETNEAEED